MKRTKRMFSVRLPVDRATAVRLAAAMAGLTVEQFVEQALESACAEAAQKHLWKLQEMAGSRGIGEQEEREGT